MATYGYGGQDIVDDRTATIDREEKKYPPPPPYEDEKYDTPSYADDPFGDEENAEVKYRTLKWWYVYLHRWNPGYR